MSAKEIITNIKKLGLTVENEKEFTELAQKNNLDLSFCNNMLTNLTNTGKIPNDNELNLYLQLLNSFLISQKVKINIENKRVKLIKL